MEPLSGCSLCESIWLNVLHVEIVQQRYIYIFFFFLIYSCQNYITSSPRKPLGSRDEAESRNLDALNLSCFKSV